MKRQLLLLLLLAAAAAAPASGQAEPFSGPIRFDYVHTNTPATAPLLASDLGGAYVKSVAASGETLSVTYQDPQGVERLATFTASTTHLAQAAWNASSETITLTLTDGSTVTVALTGLHEALADNSITEPKYGGNTVSQRALAFESVGPRELQANSVRSGHITDNSITGADIGNNQIITRHIGAQSIIRGLMAADSVGGSEIVAASVEESDLTAAVRTKLNASGGRAFGTSSGEIASWAEGDSTAQVPAAKLTGKQNRRQVLEVFPSELTDDMMGGTLTFHFTCHLNVDDIPATATHFSVFIGTPQSMRGATQPISDIAAALQVGPLQAFVTPDMAVLRQAFGQQLGQTNPQSRFIPAGLVFYDSVSAVNVVGDLQPVRIPVYTQAPLHYSTNASIWPLVDSTRTFDDPLQNERAVEPFYRRGSHITVNLNEATRFSLSNNTAVEGNIMQVRFVQPAAVPNVDFVAFPFQFQSGRFLRFPGQPIPTINRGAGESTVLRFLRTNNAWYHLGRIEDRVSSLPAFPAAGSRDNKVPKFSGDVLGWEIDATGTAGAIAANSLLPSQAQADTAARQAAWRARFDSSKIDAGNALPAATATNIGDVHIFTRPVASGLSWRDISDPQTIITSAQAGDVALYLPTGWTRAGNIVAGEQNLLLDNAANPIAASAANEDKVLYRAGKFYRVVHHHHTDPSVTYRAFATSDLPNGYSWGGVTQVSPAASSQPDNRVIYSIPGQHMLRKVTAGFATWVIYTPPNWRGAHDTESQADASVRAVGDVVYWGGSVRVVSAYTARTPERYEWEQLEQYDLREVAGQIATPATGDRFFFSDENQAGDPLRYVQLATLSDLVNAASWRGDWAAGSYSVGDLSRRAGLPWLAVSDVTSADPAPDALTNIKWLRLGAPAATETVSGTVELATTAEMGAGTAVKIPDASKVKAFVEAEVLAVNRVPRAITAVAGAANTWTYTLLSSDTEVWVGTPDAASVWSGTWWPRLFLSTSRILGIEHRNPATRTAPDSQSTAATATLSGNTLTLVTTGWQNAGTAPTVYAK